MTRPMILPLLLAAGCAAPLTAPELSTPTEPQALAAPYPTLVPLDPLLAAGRLGTLDDARIAAVQAEGAALEARGAALRDRPIDP